MIALDHAMFLAEPAPALADPARTIALCREGGADAFIVSAAAAVSCHGALGDAGVILSVRLPLGSVDGIVEEALRLNADAIKTIICPFGPEFDREISAFSALASRCRSWRVPIIAETIPGGFARFYEDPTLSTPESLAAAARIAVEHGADLVKTAAPADAAGMAALSRYAGVPVVVLGGERSPDDAYLASVEQAIAHGAAGVAVGRNAWGGPDVASAVQRIARTVHAPDAMPMPRLGARS
jgi:DhnA family fructose-bisphosphate aldolase class Ia